MDEWLRPPTMEMNRLAVEAMIPLPRTVVVGGDATGLKISRVYLDKKGLSEAPISKRDKGRLGRALISHLSRKPLPKGWVSDRNVPDKGDARKVGKARSSLSFEVWRDSLFSFDGDFDPPSPNEILRPCMLPLFFARIVASFNDAACNLLFYEEHDPRVSYFFAEHGFANSRRPLGALPGTIIEMHKGCTYAIGH